MTVDAMINIAEFARVEGYDDLTPCTAISRALARCTYNGRVRARDSLVTNGGGFVRLDMEVKVACNVADHAKTARDLQPSTYGNRREKLSRVGVIGA